MHFPRTLHRIAWCVGLALCAVSSGCRLGDAVFHTAVSEPLHYSSYWQDKFARARYRDIASEALEHEKAIARAALDNYFIEPFSVSYESGFVDGFADYLYAGGNGEPPPLPPRKMWKGKFENPDGYQAAIDWFHGFRHGASSAQASGLRNYITIPVSDMVVSDTTPYPYGRLTRAPQAEQPGAAATGPPISQSAASGEALLRHAPAITPLPSLSRNF